MQAKRKIEIFSAGCPSCQVDILDMRDGAVAARAHMYGIRNVPAVVVDGKLADCCAKRRVDEAALRAAGVGVPVP